MTVGLVMPTHFDPGSVLAGGERYAFELARAMSHTVKTTLVTFRREPGTTQVGPLTIEYCRTRFDAGSPINPVSLSHLRILGDCDVIHCLQPRTIVTDLAMLYGRLWGIPTFLTDLAGGQARSLYRVLPMQNLMTGFLPISEFNRRQNPAIIRPTTVIFGGVDATLFSPDPGVRRERDLFVYIGRIFPGKGLHLLLEALPEGAHLIVIGSSTDNDYGARVRALSAGKRVDFLGALSDPEVVAIHRRALALVLPSLVDTGFTSSMEAMACGTPVIGTRLGSLPEVVRDGVTGTLVPPDDIAALRACLEDAMARPEQYLRMADDCRSDVTARFTWDRVVDRCLTAYRR
jgi:glycosyltransferase involved in cell wall biosynthesis